MKSTYRSRWGQERKRALKGDTRTHATKKHNPPTKVARLDPAIRNGDNDEWQDFQLLPKPR